MDDVIKTIYIAILKRKVKYSVVNRRGIVLCDGTAYITFNRVNDFIFKYAINRT